MNLLKSKIMKRIFFNIVISVTITILFAACAEEDKPEIIDCLTWGYKNRTYQSFTGPIVRCNPGLAEFEDVTFRLFCSADGCVQRVEVVDGNASQSITAP